MRRREGSVLFTYRNPVGTTIMNPKVTEASSQDNGLWDSPELASGAGVVESGSELPAP